VGALIDRPINIKSERLTGGTREDDAACNPCGTRGNAEDEIADTESAGPIEAAIELHLRDAVAHRRVEPADCRSKPNDRQRRHDGRSK
jgi:hypothetical protein